MELSIGEFAEACGLSVPSLRRYGEAGLLPPFRTDERTGYRWYDADQVPVGVLVRSLRELDVPLATVATQELAGRGRAPDHVLLSGPPGLGNTTLAMIIAHELGAPLRISSGPAIQHAGDLAAILSGLVEGEVFFLDEIHRMSRPAEEMLYLAMEDFRIDIMVGKGAGATSIPLDLAPFTLVGATTRSGLLPNPLRDRFGFTGHLEFYTVEELELVLRRSAMMLDLRVTSAAF